MRVKEISIRNEVSELQVGEAVQEWLAQGEMLEILGLKVE